jgi:hypothetical protein
MRVFILGSHLMENFAIQLFYKEGSSTEDLSSVAAIRESTSFAIGGDASTTALTAKVGNSWDLSDWKSRS